MKIDMRVAELLCSRLCHELISPIGAVGNGLELLEEDAGMAADALELSIKSVRRASALLQFYRMAYGAAGSQPSVRLGDARSLAAGILEGGKIQLNWPADSPTTEAPQGMPKLILNLLLLAIDALPRGGAIAVEVAPRENGMTATITASGQDARLSDEVRAAFAAEASAGALTAKTVQAYLPACLAEVFGGRLEAPSSQPGSVRFGLTMPA